MRLAAFSGGASPVEIGKVIDRLWNIRKEAKIGFLLQSN
jgi:hypothetical protein